MSPFNVEEAEKLASQLDPTEATDAACADMLRSACAHVRELESRLRKLEAETKKAKSEIDMYSRDYRRRYGSIDDD